ncbi:MAG: NAD(P)/FAD-dependent oxidoreductase [Bacteriovoracaceae bacterium]|nr:NAD(P)/FAD-dependent oxidoreductase [Bacteriovoracaceae bacterium]
MDNISNIYDVIIIGAGASGLMTATIAARRGLNVLVLEKNKSAGKKVLVSGGGKCNFTNLNVSSIDFHSSNPHFCKSALSQYTQYDFIDWVESLEIPYEERTHGQLFTLKGAKDILNLLIYESAQENYSIKCNESIKRVKRVGDIFIVENSKGEIYQSHSLVIATGGISFPKLGASDFGYKLAKSFGHSITPLTEALVALKIKKPNFGKLSGISIEASSTINSHTYTDDLLFTHRGLSGPLMLKTSLFLDEKMEFTLNLSPHKDLREELSSNQNTRTNIKPLLNKFFPKRLSEFLIQNFWNGSEKIAESKSENLQNFTNCIHSLVIKDCTTEGYDRAEVTKGGVSVDEISSKTMESKICPSLFFVGEVCDVTGNLGGYNFQWAWSSGYVAGSNISKK